MDNSGLQLYLLEVRQHKATYLQELDALRQDLLQGALKRRDYLAAERLLQVLTKCVLVWPSIG
jgi:uncharacterized protein Smg (DUF494 family)